MKSIANPLKKQILADLQTLVDDGVLGFAESIDYKKDVWTADYSAFPAAIVLPPAITSDAEDNNNNLVNYQFTILILQKAENISSPTDVEDLIDAVLQIFATDYTLGGIAQGGVLPPKIDSAPVNPGDRSLVATVVVINAKALYELGS
jgi:hypothetical protein